MKMPVWLLLILIVISAPAVRALSPPATKPLPEVVALASHIFVGTAEDFCVIDLDGKRIQPEPQDLGSGGRAIQMKVRVDSVLYPKGWSTNSTLRVLYARDDVVEIRKRLVGKQMIYLVRFYELRTYGGGAFQAAYGLNLFEPLEKKEEIEGLIKNSAERPAKAADEADESRTTGGTVRR